MIWCASTQSQRVNTTLWDPPGEIDIGGISAGIDLSELARLMRGGFVVVGEAAVRDPFWKGMMIMTSLGLRKLEIRLNGWMIHLLEFRSKTSVARAMRELEG